MESRKESLSALKVCRFCLSQDDPLTSLYKKSRITKNAVSLPLKILSSVGIEVFPSDKMPTYICGRCQFFMDLSYEYKRICRQADENILQYIRTGSVLESITWPSKLNKVHKECVGKQSNEVAVVNAVVDGGTTVQVTTQELSDTDAEDDENVFNIKIGDTSDEGTKNTSIKVITDKEEKPKSKTKRGLKVSLPVEEGTVEPYSEIVEKGWSCTECKCIYPVQKQLEMHKELKHKPKTEECNKCDSKYITKHELNVHQSLHSNELPFPCAACDKSFKQHIQLKRHEKSVHADLPQYMCPNCPASFLSSSQLKEHQKKHVRPKPKVNYDCNICEKTFINNTSLQKHLDEEHDQEEDLTCDYCAERFSSVSKLTKHVRSHPGPKTFPCKYCNKTFVKSHHYTRHLRMKHRGIIRNRRGPFGEVEEFRCDQCDALFGSQDDLIYHSAIHATQNLICPLCQEKFDDVEAVTAHIKSHASGCEFMCDYCELIFTTKAKLDNHLTLAHDEELRSESMELDESSLELEADEDDDDNAINLKEEDGEMVVEIKKADEFMLSNYQEGTEEKLENTNSEDSEVDTYADMGPADPLTESNKDANEESEKSQDKPDTDSQPESPVASKIIVKTSGQPVGIIRKAEEIKRKVTQKSQDNGSDKREKITNKVESSTSAGPNDKSLRLLEKDLQELKRTNTRSDIVKVTAKSLDTVRNRRPQIHTSTPKIRNVEEKKPPTVTKITVLEKKVPERRLITKENKEPKDVKDNKTNNEKDKNVVKNGTTEKSNVEEGGVRRSTRPSKIKDYAKMIRESSQDSETSEEESDDLDDDDDEEFKEIERVPEPPRPKVRRSSTKPGPASRAAAAPPPTPPATTGAALPRKRGRPRKDTHIPNKIKKDDTDDSEQAKSEQDKNAKAGSEPSTSVEKINEVRTIDRASLELIKPSSTVLVSPTGHTLKKVPVKSLPPGIKALPLPVNARLGNAELCEMQIGKKVVKVQKIVMTKAEVEAMAKKGLVEMKDGTMVLKQGIKLPQQDAAVIKQTLIDGGETSKESPSKKDKATPSRCDFGEDTL